MNSLKQHNVQKLLLSLWAFSAGILLLAAAGAVPFSSEFGYQTRVIDMPLRSLFAGLFALGGLFLLLPWLIHKTVSTLSSASLRCYLLLWVIIAVVLLARLLMISSTPLMEDDYQRYLWDGALVAHGINPYRVAPQTVFEGTSGEPELQRLGEQSGLLLGRVNHPSLRTIYPPVTQAAFALAHLLKPFSLMAWRGLALLFELASLALLILLLKTLGKSPLWAALYWWNPLVIKEIMNSGHMEFLLVPLLLAALWAAIHHKALLVSVLLALAVGVKLWPVLLLPLYLRPFWKEPKKLVLPLLTFTLLLFLMALPVVRAGFDQSSGLVAYAEQWKTNSVLAPALETLAQLALSPFLALPPSSSLPALIVRLVLALLLGWLALWVAHSRPENADDFARRTLLISAAMFLLSPAQMPWYAIWFLPFLAFYPFYGLALLVPLLQIYYLSFYFEVNNIDSTLAWGSPLFIWLPVWTLLALELYECKRAGDNQPCTPLGGSTL